MRLTLEGGFASWRAEGHPLIPADKVPARDAQGRTVWVTRARPKIVRIACPWLIRRFIDHNLILLDPRPLRHVMPSIVQDDQLVVSISDQNGTLHNYTFPIQPNDLALKPIRSGCFDY
jgi:hypothetical protein